MTASPRSPLRVAVLFSGEGTGLENLCEHIDAGRVPARVVIALSSRRDVGGLARAARRGVPARAIPRNAFPDPETFNDAFHEALAPHRVELVVLLGFLSLFAPRQRYAGRVLNVHPALIPAFSGQGYYGRRVHRAVLAAGVKLSGATLHFADDSYDTGPIIFQEAVPVFEGDSEEALARRVQAVERRLVPRAVRLFAEGRLAIRGRRVRILPPGEAAQPEAAL